MTSPVPRVNQVYAQPDHPAKTNCRHANTGLPHNPECSCGWNRASQIEPYREEVDLSDEFPESPYKDI